MNVKFVVVPVQSHELKSSISCCIVERILLEGNWKPPDWWYRDKRPESDDAYFENMTRAIFQAGLNWSVIEKKWPTIRKAFEGFSINKVSRFNDNDVRRLLSDKGIVRNKNKVCATIQNAVEFQAIKGHCGSFETYLDSLAKSDNYLIVITELTKRFKHLGPSSARLFLYAVGEKIDPWAMG